MYKNIFLILFISYIIQSCSILGLFQSNIKVSGDFVVELKPKDIDPVFDRAVNVIQGIAAFEDGFFTSQTSESKYVIINYINKNGESKFATRVNMNSHAQDLSYEQVSENELIMYTSIGNFDIDDASGIVSLKVVLPEKINGFRDMSKTIITKGKKHFIGYRNCTPTLSEDKKSIALRSADLIFFGDKEDILSNNKESISQFNIDKDQLMDKNSKSMWFQGITMKDDIIYCLTGNSSIGSEKKIFAYDLQGNVLKKFQIEEDTFAQRLGSKLEPEGMTFVGDDLYFTLMTKGSVGGNRKFLFKLKM